MTQAAAIRAVCQIFIDAVKEAGTLGAPGGVLYSAVVDKLSLQQFESIMSVLVQTGKLRKKGDLYFWVADI